MQKKPTIEGTLLYPGVILRGSNILANPTSKFSSEKFKGTCKTIRKTETKPSVKKNKIFVNILVEE